jgi:hypothetical protein
MELWTLLLIAITIKLDGRERKKNKIVPQHAYGRAGGEDVQLLLIQDIGTRWG